jgi:hypothetical protein
VLDALTLASDLAQSGLEGKHRRCREAGDHAIDEPGALQPTHPGRVLLLLFSQADPEGAYLGRVVRVAGKILVEARRFLLDFE